MSGQRSKVRVVVDGSNMATEGRSDPSLAQLDEVLRAFQAENPRVELIVVADATFAHRVAPGERARFQQREIEGTIVTPPAGAIGRGDAFILKIADRIAGVVLSNDSFQEFHHLYPWLFDEGRLIGGKPVPGVGWIFTPRLPVRGAKSVRATRKAALAAVSTEPIESAVAAPAEPTKRVARSRRAAPAEPAVAEPAEPIKRTARSRRAAPIEPAVAALAEPVMASPTQRTARSRRAAPAEPAVAAPAEPTKRAARSRRRDAVEPVLAPTTQHAAHPRLPEPPVEISSSTPRSQRREHGAVNDEMAFAALITAVPVGSVVDGTVRSFTSHGAVVDVRVDGVDVECYAPTAMLGDPAPARAREVLVRGEMRRFRLISVDPERRIGEVGLP